MKNLTIAFLTLLTIFTSCSKDKDKDDAPGKLSRTIRYEVTGNFTGNFYASYTTSGGGTNNEQVMSLPWTKEITYEQNVVAATIVLSGAGGTVGQQATLIRKRDGKQAGTPMIATADAAGGFSIGAPALTF
ncbi:MAG TPA: hypothetical protein VKB19_16460 [Pedobacter sp.]|nr:hypothetical protein [Pedobacter sp.]